MRANSAAARYYQRNKEHLRARDKTPEWRAKRLVNAARCRASGEFSITAEWVKERIERGVCEATDLPFDLGEFPGSAKNPFAPSIDRIDSNKGYTTDNVQVVAWIYNLMKGQLPDGTAKCVLLLMAKGVIDARTKRAA